MLRLISEEIESELKKYRIYVEADYGKVGVDVYHPVSNRVACRFYPDSIPVAEDDFEDCTVAISYPCDVIACKRALDELIEEVEHPNFNLVCHFLNEIVNNQEQYFRE